MRTILFGLVLLLSSTLGSFAQQKNECFENMDQAVTFCTVRPGKVYRVIEEDTAPVIYQNCKEIHYDKDNRQTLIGCSSGEDNIHLWIDGRTIINAGKV
jgi:hypothetical protein